MKHAPLRAADAARIEPLLAPAAAHGGLAGWLVVAGAFIVNLVGYGAIYSYAAFADEIAASFGTARGSVALVYALSGGACFFVSAISGRLADRLGARLPAVIGMTLVGLGLLLAAAATSMIEVYVGYGLLIGLGVGFAYVPAIAVVQRWFAAHRGLASGVAVSGIGVGTALIPPLAERFSGEGDWRHAFVICGIGVIVVGAAAALLLRWPPDDAGFEGAPATAAPATPPTAGSREFALIYAGTLLVSAPAVVPHAMLVATARDLGIPAGDAVALLGLIGLGTIAGRFILAALADEIGRRIVFIACCAGMSAVTLVWAAAATIEALQGFALAFGALQGGFVALLPAFVADRFGVRSVGSLLGLLYTSRGIALVAVPLAMAHAIAVSVGHAVPLIALALAGAAGTALFAIARR
jgi:MFS family permease